MTDNPNQLPIVKLKHFVDADVDAFMQMVADPEIKEYFDELDDDDEMIRYKFMGINDNILSSQYWGIYLPDGELAGFVSLKKRHAIYKTLHKKNHQPTGDIDELTFESNEETKAREWREKINSPYAADVAIHPNFRRRGIGKAALIELQKYAASVSLNAIYFEVREDNDPSSSLIAGMAPKQMATAEEHYYHDLYRFDIEWQPMSGDEMKEELKKMKTTEDKILYNHWRQIVTAIPELTTHRDLVMKLFKAILAEGAMIDMKEEYTSCHHIKDLFEKAILISLKKRDEPLTIIWSIAHEFGHLLQEEATDEEQKLYTIEKFRREEDAWKKAEQWLSIEPFFIFNWRDFFKFRHDRLNNYLLLPE